MSKKFSISFVAAKAVASRHSRSIYSFELIIGKVPPTLLSFCYDNDDDEDVEDEDDVPNDVDEPMVSVGRVGLCSF